MQARQNKVLAIGPADYDVDPARFGDNGNNQAKGRSTRSRSVRSDPQWNPGIVHSIIRNEKLNRVAVDVGGLFAIVDG